MVVVLNLVEEGEVFARLASPISTLSSNIQLAKKSSDTRGDPVRPEWTSTMAGSSFVEGNFV